MPIQPSPARAARRSAAPLSPPTRIGGHGCCTGLGSNATASKWKNSPWCATSGSVQSRLHTSIASSTRRPRVSKSSSDGAPLLLEPARADAELDAPARHDVERLHGARRDERVAQPEVVDVGAEPQVVGFGRRGSRGTRTRRTPASSAAPAGASSPGCGERLIAHGKHEVLGQPHRLVAEALGLVGGVEVEVRVERAERDPELHVREASRRRRGASRRRRGCRRRRGSSCRSRTGRGRWRGTRPRRRRRRRGRRAAAACCIGRSTADARRRDHVGRDAVDPDHPGPELERQGLGEARHRGLHRRVHGEAGRGAVRLDRRDVDDRAAGVRASAARRPGRSSSRW